MAYINIPRAGREKKEKYVLKSYDGTLNELLGQCPVRHKKSDAWIQQNCISKNNPPLKCISTGLPGGLPVKTSDGFYVKLSPTYDSDLWNELPEATL